jgi:hypothetical protein
MIVTSGNTIQLFGLAYRESGLTSFGPSLSYDCYWFKHLETHIGPFANRL